MTVRQSVVAKLLVSLEDEKAVETLPLDEIEANLRCLGSDPAALIVFAERLATAARPPAKYRLAKLEDTLPSQDRLSALLTLGCPVASLENR